MLSKASSGTQGVAVIFFICSSLSRIDRLIDVYKRQVVNRSSLDEPVVIPSAYFKDKDGKSSLKATWYSEADMNIVAAVKSATEINRTFVDLSLIHISKKKYWRVRHNLEFPFILVISNIWMLTVMELLTLMTAIRLVLRMFQKCSTVSSLALIINVLISAVCSRALPM